MSVFHSTNNESAPGNIAFWSYSPALRFCELEEKIPPRGMCQRDHSSRRNLLLFGVPDLALILANLTDAWESDSESVNFHITDISIEVYARQLLFLWILSQPADRISDENKVWTLMELIASTHVRPSTVMLVRQAAEELIKFVAEDQSDLLAICDIAFLRHRERDMLENVFASWRADAEDPRISTMWDTRVRHHLGVRYDAKMGLFDWDYYMVVKDRLDLPFLSPEEYKQWRATGTALGRPGGEQTCVNRTLISRKCVPTRCGKRLCSGYWGDIVTGPFYAFGVNTANTALCKKQNDRLVANSTGVYFDNLRSLLSKTFLDRIRQAGAVRVMFLPLACGDFLRTKSQFGALFDTAYFSCGMSQMLDAQLAGCFTDDVLVVMETGKHLVWLHDSQLVAAEKLISSAVCAAGFEEIDIKDGEVIDAQRAARESEEAVPLTCDGQVRKRREETGEQAESEAEVKNKINEQADEQNGAELAGNDDDDEGKTRQLCQDSGGDISGRSSAGNKEKSNVKLKTSERPSFLLFRKTSFVRTK